MAQRDDSKVSFSFIDDKTVLLSLDDLADSQTFAGEDIDDEAPEIQELRDSLLMVVRQLAGPKLN